MSGRGDGSERPRVLVLSMNPLGDDPHGRLPYGMQHLAECGFDLAWSDAAHRGRWSSRPVRLIRGLGRRAAPGRQGWATAHVSGGLVPGADAVVSVFENAGLGFAAGHGRGRPQHVMVSCWLAEDVLGMSSVQRRALSRSLSSVSRLAVFSQNQTYILAERLDLDRSQVTVVPFGVDVDLYQAPSTPRGGGGCVAVGSDSRRDYATLFSAVAGTGIPVTVVAAPRNIEGLSPPPEATVRYGVFDDAYRELLHSADLVITPTLAPAYPSGQSVVLEAMAMGAPTLTTDSPAMRDYVRPGVTGELVPARDPSALRSAIVAMLGDDEHRRSLAVTAADDVRSRFSTRHMWSAVGDLVGQREVS